LCEQQQERGNHKSEGLGRFISQMGLMRGDNTTVKGERLIMTVTAAENSEAAKSGRQSRLGGRGRFREKENNVGHQTVKTRI